MSARTLMVWIGAALLAACSSKEPSRLDEVVDEGKPGTAGDPWAKSTGSDAEVEDSNDDSGLAGIDIKGMLEKLQESLKKPGPYEAPEKSKDFDEAKPHWGVMKVKGGIVE